MTRSLSLATLKQKRKAGLCATPFCRNKRGEQRRICYKCTKRRYRARHPMKEAFFNLRNNAGKRGHKFTLTFEDFKQFCQDTGYMEKRGRSKTKASIDRKDETKGYEPGNIRILTVSQNSRRRYNPMDDFDDIPF